MGLHGDSGRGAGSAEKALLEAPHTIVKRVMHINELVIAVHGLLVCLKPLLPFLSHVCCSLLLAAYPVR